MKHLIVAVLTHSYLPMLEGFIEAFKPYGDINVVVVPDSGDALGILTRKAQVAGYEGYDSVSLIELDVRPDGPGLLDLDDMVEEGLIQVESRGDNPKPFAGFIFVPKLHFGFFDRYRLMVKRKVAKTDEEILERALGSWPWRLTDQVTPYWIDSGAALVHYIGAEGKEKLGADPITSPHRDAFNQAKAHALQALTQMQQPEQ